MSERLCDKERGWEIVVDKCMYWPENNTLARVVYKKYGLGESLIYRFDENGKEIYNNETRFAFGPMM